MYLTLIQISAVIAESSGYLESCITVVVLSIGSFSLCWQFYFAVAVVLRSDRAAQFKESHPKDCNAVYFRMSPKCYEVLFSGQMTAAELSSEVWLGSSYHLIFEQTKFHSWKQDDSATSVAVQSNSPHHQSNEEMQFDASSRNLTLSPMQCVTVKQLQPIYSVFSIVYRIVQDNTV